MINHADIAAFQPLYLKTAFVYINDLKKLLASDWETRAKRETEEKLYIISHSLASQSAAMGYENISALCSIFEKIFYEIKEKGVALTDPLTRQLQNGAEMLENALKQLADTKKEPDLSGEIDTLNKMS